MQLCRLDEAGIDGLIGGDAVLSLQKLFSVFCEGEEGSHLFMAACPDSLALNKTLRQESVHVLFHPRLGAAIPESNQDLITKHAKATKVIYRSDLILADGIDLPADSY